MDTIKKAYAAWLSQNSPSARLQAVWGLIALEWSLPPRQSREYAEILCDIFERK
jgi:hypothetical protein